MTDRLVWEGVKLTLIRHAQPAWSQQGRLVGNPGLTELGRLQARQLAERPFTGVDELWVSELRRARETAAPLAARLGLRPAVHPWMNEIGDPVEWDGMPINLVASAHLPAGGVVVSAKVVEGGASGRAIPQLSGANRRWSAPVA